MAAGKYSFSIEQGTTINFELIYKDSTGQPVNLSGYSGKMQIRPDYADNTNNVFLTLSSSLNADGTGLNFSGSSGTNPLASGSIGIFISSCTSSMFTFNEGLYDLELYQPGPVSGCPVVTRLLEGKIKILKEVTR